MRFLSKQLRKKQKQLAKLLESELSARRIIGRYEEELTRQINRLAFIRYDINVLSEEIEALRNGKADESK